MPYVHRDVLVISLVKSQIRESRTSGSVRGIPRKGYVYLTSGK